MAHVVKTNRGDAGTCSEGTRTRRCSYRNRGNQSCALPVRLSRCLTGLHGYGKSHVPAPSQHIFAKCTGYTNVSMMRLIMISVVLENLRPLAALSQASAKSTVMETLAKATDAPDTYSPHVSPASSCLLEIQNVIHLN